jgi:hypothetical protein
LLDKGTETDNIFKNINEYHLTGGIDDNVVKEN